MTLLRVESRKSIAGKASSHKVGCAYNPLGAGLAGDCFNGSSDQALASEGCATGSGCNGNNGECGSLAID